MNVPLVIIEDELELDTTELEMDEELLGIELDEYTTAELELRATEDELLDGALELLLGIELDEDTSAELEL